jgi:hypothetical protein
MQPRVEWTCISLSKPGYRSLAPATNPSLPENHLSSAAVLVQQARIAIH